MFPSATIRTVPFTTETTYSQWSFRMKALLQSQGVWRLVCTDAAMQSELDLEMSEAEKVADGRDRLLKTRLMLRRAAFGVLALAVQDDHIPLIAHIPEDRPDVFWTTLKDHYESSSLMSKANVRRALDETKYEKTEEYDTYVGRVMTHIRKLEEMGNKMGDDEILHHVTKGLPVVFQPAIMALQLNKGIKIKEIHTMLREFQQQWVKTKGATPSSKSATQFEDGSAYMVDNQRNNQRNNNNRNNFNNNSSNQNNNNNNSSSRFPMRCFTCNEIGHRAFECEKNRDKKKCDFCRGIGHTVNECRKKLKQGQSGGAANQQRGNNNYNNNYNNNNRSTSSSSSYRSPSAAYVGDSSDDDQYVNCFAGVVDSAGKSDNVKITFKKPATSINLSAYNYSLRTATAQPAEEKTQSDIPSVEFVIDSGATHTAIKDKEVFTQMQEIEQLHIKTANKARVPINHAGTITLPGENSGAASLEITNALYAPQFDKNLISVASIVDGAAGNVMLFDRNNAYVVKESWWNENPRDPASMNNIQNHVVMTIPRKGNLYVAGGDNKQKPVNNNINNVSLADSSSSSSSSSSTAASSSSSSASSSSSPTSTPLVDSAKTDDSNRASLLRLLSQVKHLHAVCGHISMSQLQRLVKSGSIIGLESLNNKQFLSTHFKLEATCEACAMGKTNRKAFGQHNPHEHLFQQILDGTVSDIAGPIEIISKAGNRYLLTVIDVSSRKIHGFLLKQKSDAAEAIMKWVREQKTATGQTLKSFHSDNGTEFVNKELKSFFASEGIRFTTTTKGTPQHNGIAERSNRTIFEMARALLYHAQLPGEFWSYAALEAIRIINKCITKNDEEYSPEVLWKIGVQQLLKREATEYMKPEFLKSTLKHHHVFGCNVFAHVQDTERKKLGAKAYRCINLGYEELRLGTILYNIDRDRVEVSRDCTFDDDQFTFARGLTNKSIRPLRYSKDDDYDYYDNLNLFDQSEPVREISQEEQQQAIIPDQQNNNNEIKENEQSAENEPADESSPSPPVTENKENQSASSSPPSPSTPPIVPQKKKKVKFDSEIDRRFILPVGRRQVRPLTRLGANTNTEHQQRMVNSCILVAQAEADTQFTTPPTPHTDSIQVEPKSYAEAINSPDRDKWQAAMQEEMDSLKANGTWKLITLPKGANLVGSKWIYKLKRDSANKVIRWKARLVVQGFTQKEGIDYKETFAPVMKYKSFRILLSLAARLDYEMKHLDVPTAFLNAGIEEDVYVKQPKGFEEGGKEWVCKLLKALYGTKQASKNWHELFDSFFISQGFTACRTDPCIYVKKSRSGRVMLTGMFVDDIIPVFSIHDESEWNEIKTALVKEFNIKDTGDAEWVLGMKVTRDRKNRTITLDQSVYINKVLTQFQMDQCKPVDTPTNSYKLTNADSPSSDNNEQSVDVKVYEAMVGSFLYASISTRPDITYAVNRVSRYMKNPGGAHLIACKRILRYLHSTSALGLTFGTQNNNSHSSDSFHSSSSPWRLDAYSDSDWCGDLDDRRSTTGYIVQLNGDPISWVSKRQPTIALSSCEAEYMAISATVQEVKWIHQFINEIIVHDNVMKGFSSVKKNFHSTGDARSPSYPPSVIHVDNQSAISISKNDLHHNRTKHIDVRHHFIRESLKNKEVTLQWIPTEFQLADIFTKSLARIAFERLRDKIMTPARSDNDQQQQ